MSIYDKASLVLIPSGTKTSKVYSQKPVNGDGDFTFSRSTAATRVNADGNIEKETQNLLLQSNSFNTTWSGFNGASGQTGYDGSSDAWRYDSSSSVLRLQQTGITFSGVHTFSFYAKYVDAQWFALQIAGTTDESAWFDIQNGTLGSTSSAVDSSITSIGGGWYRCSVTGSASNQNRVRLYVVGSDGSLSNITASLLIQDAQLEQGLVARDYIETTTAAVEGGITDNVPRLDYTDSSCPALLLEPQRTNLVTQSEYLLGGSGWSAANLDRNANAVVSPEGVQNGTEIVATGSGGHPIYEDLSSTSNGTYTLSMFVKKGVNTSKGDLSDGYSTTSASFDLDTATINADTAQTLNPFIEPYNNGWYRVGYTLAVTANQSQPALYLFDSSGNQNYTANGETMYIYGFQIEAGSYATSYIPTYGTSVTRNEDSCAATSVEDLIGQTQGTLFAEFTIDNSIITGANRIFSATDGTTNNRMLLLSNSAESMRFYLASGGSVIFDQNYSSILNGPHKVALGYSTTGLVGYMDGVKLFETTASYNIPATTNLYLGTIEGGSSGAGMEGNAKQALVFKTRLSNEELADLTT